MKILDLLNKELSNITAGIDYLRTPPPTREPLLQMTEEEKKKHLKILLKHGTPQDMPTIINEPGQVPYYFKDGQRIKFK